MPRIYIIPGHFKTQERRRLNDKSRQGKTYIDPTTLQTAINFVVSSFTDFGEKRAFIGSVMSYTPFELLPLFCGGDIQVQEIQWEKER